MYIHTLYLAPIPHGLDYTKGELHRAKVRYRHVLLVLVCVLIVGKVMSRFGWDRQAREKELPSLATSR